MRNAQMDRLLELELQLNSLLREVSSIEGETSREVYGLRVLNQLMLAAMRTCNKLARPVRVVHSQSLEPNAVIRLNLAG